MEKISGLGIRKVQRHSDDRGWLTEVFRQDEQEIRPVMSYISHTNFNAVRGPHEHKSQTDYFAFLGYGDFEIYLWDNRKDSDTYGNFVKLIVGESNPVIIEIPPGIVHGYKAVTKKGALSINLPDKLYAGKGKKEKVDEIRHEDSKHSKFVIK